MPKFNEQPLDKEHPPSDNTIRLEAKGSQCPGPIMVLQEGVKTATKGQQILIEVTDPGFKQDVVAWCHVTGNELASLTEDDGIIKALVIKKIDTEDQLTPNKEDSLTIVMFSCEMDKAIAAFNIALGALAMGLKVQIFFTFWGLSLLKKTDDDTQHEEKHSESLLSKMLLDTDKNLPLSHWNTLGLGRMMMEHIMKEKNIPSVNFMVHLAKFDGVRFIACQMSMSVLELKPEDLIDGIEFGGVATMIECARKSNLNYFI